MGKSKEPETCGFPGCQFPWYSSQCVVWSDERYREKRKELRDKLIALEQKYGRQEGNRKFDDED